ncbi:Restriction endonuclease [Pelosinus fermentans]|uniref:nSTAND3 domain-containing NTPase n=1 Tax=Pelosinus fermentans TaxID=365349 RepID=UPI0007D74A81|nr:restriction endonuclease [Pelosinus fermentans]OAM92461.1 restriction endonuclease [Pelosinus fermentans DSM 17108]SDQ45648.1 Restriction endonuclease [Pelosinus fermentans]
MFHYANLNDVEFENLCKDIMEKQLSTSLRLFAKGRDGGIDFTDSTITHNIIVQAKHYIGSKFSDLRTTLRKEIDNVRKWNPNQYYICCGMQLTDANIKEIYDLFSIYMKTDKNIITLREIDEFLQKPENSDVVRKHYKLWLYASNILNEIYNQNIFIDCESLLSDIDEESKYFVQTNIYEQCIDHLDKNGLLMITGGPGVGKTTTSKMLVLYYATQGFRVRYTTNGDITDIKKSLSHEKECKEIVLLDDCLGQHYFNMKHTQENELLSLIKYVKLSKNKKIILNSRITIFNEAKERSRDFNIFFQEKKIRNYTIDMDDISLIEKAEIFYNHLISKCIPKEYYNNIKENKNYLKIVQHNNYTPRIIEHVTYESNYSKVTPEQYFNYIIENLIEPNNIWKNEFERRLQDVDRAFLSTVYSLTDTNIEYKVLKKCFESRLYNMKNIDSTIDNYESILYRLNQSIINVIDNKGGKHIGVINPSVNDYLKSIFFHNKLELQEVRKSICHFKQFERCYKKEELDNVYLSLINNHKVEGVDFSNEKQKLYFIVAHMCKFNIKDGFYQQTILNYLCDAYFYYSNQKDWLSHREIFSLLINGDFYSYYSISNFILDEDYVSNLLWDLDLEELVFTVKLLNECYKKNGLKVLWFKSLCKDMLNDAIKDHVENIDAAEYCDNYNIGTLIEHDEDGNFDRRAIINNLRSRVAENIEQEIQEHLLDLDSDIYSDTMLSITDYVSTDGIDNYIDSYFEPDYDDEHRERGRSSSDGISEIEAIFE